MLSIIVPTYNRGRLLDQTIKEMVSYFEDRYDPYELIVVFDGGTLETKATLYRLYKQYSSVKVLFLRENVGQQNATLAGLRKARYPSVITMDDDLEHDLQSLPKMLQMLNEGYDIVYGVSSRAHRQVYRSMGTRLKECLFRMVLGKPKKMTLTSYKVMTRQVVDHLCMDQSRYVYLSAMLLRRPIKIGQVDSNNRNSIDPYSGYTIGHLIKVLLRIVIYYGPRRLFGIFRKKGSQYNVEEWLG